MGLFFKKTQTQESYQHLVDDDILVRVHNRATRLNLRAVVGKPDHRFILTIPKRTPAHYIESFVRKQRDWLNKIRNNNEAHKSITEGTELSILGNNVLVVYGGDYPRKHTVLKEGELLVYGDKGLIGSRVIRFFKKQAKDIFTDKVAYFADLAGCEISQIRVTDTKSRWGSCTSDGVISLSWRLLLAPEMGCDYVIAHEISHRFHMDHSSDFWRFCEKLYPKTKQAKKWLKINGNDLHSWQA